MLSMEVDVRPQMEGEAFKRVLSHDDDNAAGVDAGFGPNKEEEREGGVMPECDATCAIIKGSECLIKTLQHQRVV